MVTLIRNLWQNVIGRESMEAEETELPAVETRSTSEIPDIHIDPGDPLIHYFQDAPGAVEIDKVNLSSPGLTALKAAGVKLVVPLISQGELIGLLNLGPRLSEQDYSTDDRKLLNDLATQASPAVRVAQLVRQQQIEARERERIDQELRVARIIQQTLLPKELPALEGWHVAAHYQPARAVGGDFYDFIQFADGKLGLFVGDVTDKGVPAALVMATTRSILRTAAERVTSPGKVLERANELLCPDIPTNMFVTCLYALIDPINRNMVFANAGHNLPYRQSATQVDELRATGMPLGLMTGMQYEEKEVEIHAGETILFFSDGLPEAHSPQHEMFGFPRLKQLMAEYTGKDNLIEYLLEELKNFTGPNWEQEDDVTCVTLKCTLTEPAGSTTHLHGLEGLPDWRKLDNFNLASKPGNERLAIERVNHVLRGVNLPEKCLQRLETAVGEATMNAMEHGNQYSDDKPVYIQIYTNDKVISVRITDHGGNNSIPDPDTPDIEAKLAGLQRPRGWGLFLIKNMVDDMNVFSDETHHTVELIMNLQGEKNANQDS